tara:strand:+ start:2420 stop:2566 length:147 start_codon:yes stop_codon:yes gene_type:complete
MIYPQIFLLFLAKESNEQVSLASTSVATTFAWIALLLSHKRRTSLEAA